MPTKLIFINIKKKPVKNMSNLLEPPIKQESTMNILAECGNFDYKTITMQQGKFRDLQSRISFKFPLRRPLIT